MPAKQPAKPPVHHVKAPAPTIWQVIAASFSAEQVVQWVKDLIATALVVLLGFVVAWGPNLFSKTASDWKVAIATAVAAVAATVLGWLDKSNTRYGIGAIPK